MAVSRYVGSELSTVLTSTLRPPMFVRLPFHPDSFVDALSRIGCRWITLKHPMVIGSPKYVMGKLTREPSKFYSTSSRLTCEQRIGTT
jgi:hypothetical protein